MNPRRYLIRSSFIALAVFAVAQFPLRWKFGEPYPSLFFPSFSGNGGFKNGVASHIEVEGSFQFEYESAVRHSSPIFSRVLKLSRLRTDEGQRKAEEIVDELSKQLWPGRKVLSVEFRETKYSVSLSKPLVLRREPISLVSFP